jgi:hypothetical protein
MSDDDAKKIILARRARFVAAAVASVGIACGKTESGPPMPCLSIAVPNDAEPPPQPCLSVPLPPDAGPPPMPCLSPMPADASAFDPPADAGADATIPVPCLSIRPPTKDPKKK